LNHPDQDPRLLEELPESVYGILEPFELAPTFFNDFLSIDLISNEEAKSLGQVLGAELTQEARNDLQVIIKRFVSAIALSGRLPKWKAYERRLLEIDQRAGKLLDAARQFKKITRRSPQEAPSPPGVLSLEQSVKHYLALAGGDYDLQLDLTSVRRACKRALKRITPLATKRGRRGDLNFRLFVEALYPVARLCGARITLPSGQIKERDGPDQRTDFFKFVRATLELTIQKGCTAIQQADLSEAEKEEALKILRQASKRDGGLLEDLRRAKKSVAQPASGEAGPS
jgi:hypothetical protein